MKRLTFVPALMVMITMPISMGEELPSAKPEAIGLSATKLEELKPALAEARQLEGKIPGAVALVAAPMGKVGYVTSVGYRDVASKTSITEDTIFAIASMTKPVTCVAAMILVEQGKLALDDPVEKYLPELKDLRVLGDPKKDTEKEFATVPSKRPITIRNLFTHTSGFGYGFTILGDTSQNRLQEVYTRGGVIRGNSRTIADQVRQL